jgi:hypothetical protein
LALAVLAASAGLPPVREVVATLLSGRLPPTETAEQLAALGLVGIVGAAVAYLSFVYATATPAEGA